MEKTIVAILYGGKSSEHRISKISAASVLRNFDRSRFTIILIGIGENGQWYLQDQQMADRVYDGDELQISEENIVFGAPGNGLVTADNTPVLVDIIFPVLHGANGEDGTVQGFLETLDLPYVGAGILASALCINKIRAKEIWHNAGLPVVPFTSLRRADNSQNDTPQYTAGSTGSTGSTEKRADIFENLAARFGLPFFIKPCRAGSSIGISKVRTFAEFQPAMEMAFRFDYRIIVEKAINAREIECSVFGNDTLRCFPPGEVMSSHDFYDYSSKYLDHESSAFEIPAQLSTKTRLQIEDYALKAFRELGGQGLARVDFFIDRDIDRDSENIYLNEINTMPGFTAISMYAKMCAASGMNLSALLETITHLGIERHKQKLSLHLRYNGNR